MNDIKVIGGGLAGCEAAWQLAQRGINVELWEMRPNRQTGAHTGGLLAELVCSNSLGTHLPDRASSLLQEELRRFDCLLLRIAEENAVPAGGSLAVDRQKFAEAVTHTISNHPRIQVLRKEADNVPTGPTIIATGPLTSPPLAKILEQLIGHENLYFFDAIAPIIQGDSIDMSIAFTAARFEKGDTPEGDYINCPLTEKEYFEFITALKSADRVTLKEFESQINTGVTAGAGHFFEGCLPIEVLASRGERSLAFGPMRPIGLHDPHTSRRPFAVLQLRQDNLAKTSYNMVGFQTNLTFSEQKRVFRMVPGLQQAEFVRFGQMHRNTYIASPITLRPSLQTRTWPDLFMAGQIIGVEGYMGNIATGLLAGINAARFLQNKPTYMLPVTTMVGAICRYITEADLNVFQPVKANFGILPALIKTKIQHQDRNRLYTTRARAALDIWMKEVYDG
ncbi:MAG TPA: methylenetetrahydrofolate--tRNA-(uracil(54)-C(5))-methyltransferase (FADH(2)-oxidizing) TrmFO [Longilinea sp.]|nr:methylenetetrahydrofolate--tRNA-(uracil(54)-C(5))-methyltransferase (FADH(2)-oxidizing) TrmFO [Longilinea sp.]